MLDEGWMDAYLGIIAIRELYDEGMGIGNPGSLFYLYLAGIFPAQKQILFDGRCKESRLLAHQPYLLS